MYTYIHIYIYICVYLYVYIYIYMYIFMCGASSRHHCTKGGSAVLSAKSLTKGNASYNKLLIIVNIICVFSNNSSNSNHSNKNNNNNSSSSSNSTCNSSVPQPRVPRPRAPRLRQAEVLRWLPKILPSPLGTKTNEVLRIRFFIMKGQTSEVLGSSRCRRIWGSD